MKGNVKFILTVLFLCLQTTVFPASQAAVGDTSDVLTDGGLPVYHLRKPDAKEMDSYRNDPVFQYEKNGMTTPEWLVRFQNWINDKLRISRGSDGMFPFEWSVLFQILAVGLVVVAVYLLIRYKYRFPIGHDRLYAVSDATEMLPEKMDGASYSVLLEKAVQEKDFTLAVRIHYLYLLYLLNRKGIIKQEKYKTNFAYLSEIKDARMKAMFQKSSRMFDCVCYGEFSIDEPVFLSIEKEFKMFQQEIGE